MARTLLKFSLLVIVLGLCTVWLIEQLAGTDLAAHPTVSNFDAGAFYRDKQAQVMHWWHQANGRGDGPHFSSVKEEAPAPGQQIVKWRDASGTWHYENRPVPPPQSPPSPSPAAPKDRH